jgi:hypothetical protein
MARSYSRDDWDLLAELARAQLDPSAPSTLLSVYWRAQMQDKPSEALAILKDARSRGVQLPIDAP